MKYGYIRVSTKSQAIDGNSIEAQKEALLVAGVESLFIDTYTGSKMQRPAFSELLEKVSEGDTIVITKIDRFARTIGQ
jgi:DNA invertase Pin-like site-specific DNA recombinase